MWANPCTSQILAGLAANTTPNATLPTATRRTAATKCNNAYHANLRANAGHNTSRNTPEHSHNRNRTAPNQQQNKLSAHQCYPTRKRLYLKRREHAFSCVCRRLRSVCSATTAQSSKHPNAPKTKCHSRHLCSASVVYKVIINTGRTDDSNYDWQPMPLKHRSGLGNIANAGLLIPIFLGGAGSALRNFYPILGMCEKGAVLVFFTLLKSISRFPKH